MISDRFDELRNQFHQSLQQVPHIEIVEKEFNFKKPKPIIQNLNPQKKYMENISKINDVPVEIGDFAVILKDLRQRYCKDNGIPLTPETKKQNKKSVSPREIRLQKVSESKYQQVMANEQMGKTERCILLHSMCLVDQDCQRILGKSFNRTRIVQSLRDYGNLQLLKNKRTKDGVLVAQCLHSLLIQLKQ